MCLKTTLTLSVLYFWKTNPNDCNSGYLQAGLKPFVIETTFGSAYKELKQKQFKLKNETIKGEQS